MAEFVRLAARITGASVKEIPLALYEGKAVTMTKVASLHPNDSKLGVPIRTSIALATVGSCMYFDNPTDNTKFGQTKMIIKILACPDGSFLVCTQSGSDYLIRPDPSVVAEKTAVVSHWTSRFGVGVKKLLGWGS